MVQNNPPRNASRGICTNCSGPEAPKYAPNMGITKVRYPIGTSVIRVENLDLLKTVVIIAAIAGEHRDRTNSQPEKTLSVVNT